MKGSRKLVFTIGGIVLFLVIAHITLPFAIRSYVLRTLNKIPGYQAQVGRLYVNLFRGAYQIQQIKREKTSGGVDASQGTFSVFPEMQVEHGKIQGYIKPILKHLEIARWKEAKENPLKVLWETIVAGVAEILKNQPKDQIATRIPLSGDIGNPDAGFFATIGNLLRNAYIQALFPNLEGYLGRGGAPKGNAANPQS